MDRHFETVIIGGGQAGLSVAYHLARQNRSSVILDANERIGDSWRTRWDSLRVFTPAKYNGLPGMRFPAPSLSFPTKDEVADYMCSYAAKFDLQVRNRVSVEAVTRTARGFAVMSNAGTYEADTVVVATGAHHAPKIPGFASHLDPQITQIHSSAYKNPTQLRQGAVLVVGAGNSGAEISFDLSSTHRVCCRGIRQASCPSGMGPPLPPSSCPWSSSWARTF